MLTKAVITLTASLLALPLWAGSAVFEKSGWPGEGIPVIEATQSSIEVREAPYRDSDSTTIAADNPLEFDRSVVITHSPIQIEVSSSQPEHHCRNTHTIDAGERLCYLQYKADGLGLMVPGECDDGLAVEERERVLCQVSVRDGSVFKGGAPGLPDTQWWVRLINSDKESLGWLEVREANGVTVTDRIY